MNEQRRVLTDATAEEIMAEEPGWRRKVSSRSVRSMYAQIRVASSVNTAIWSNQGAPSELRLAYAGFERVELPQWDVAVASETPLADRRELSARYAAVWRADVEFESRLLSKIPVEGVVERMRPLLAAGYGPFSIAVESYDSDGESDGGAGEQGSSLCSVVLHRPLIPTLPKNRLP